jgi:DNA-binding CsgD family transcriptional regulator
MMLVVDVALFAAVCTGSMAFVLLWLFGARTGTRAWRLTAMMLGVLVLQSVNLRVSLRGFGEGPLVALVIRQTAGVLINLTMLALFPFLLEAFGIIGRGVCVAFVSVVGLLSVYQVVVQLRVFRWLSRAGEVAPPSSLGSIVFIAYILACFLLMIFGKERGPPIFRVYVRGGLPFLFTVFPFLAADLIRQRSLDFQSPYAPTGIILYFLLLFLYTVIHFYNIARSSAPDAAGPATSPGPSRARWGLSEREAEVLGFMLKGKTNPQIADALFISIATVKTHTNHIFQKTNTHNRLELFAKSQTPGG